VRIDHVSIGVADLEAARRWYLDVLGLREIASYGNRLFFGCGGRETFDLVIQDSPTGLHHVAYSAADDAEYESAIRRLASLPAAAAAGDEPGVVAVAAARLPGGHVIEVVRRDSTERYVQSVEWSPAAAGSPRELDHVNIAVVAVDAAVAALQTALGLVLSDLHEVDGVNVAAWLRAGERHHDFAVIANRGNGLHHLAYQLIDSAAMAVFADRLVRFGYRAEYGIGRHGPGSNLFLYTRDPSGNRVELCADMALVPRGSPHRKWVGRDDRILNSWAPYPPPRSFWEITPQVESGSALDEQTT
jgi:catechol 2,3-dioxygenase-like lactoylglutathione lyase family enzyme